MCRFLPFVCVGLGWPGTKTIGFPLVLNGFNPNQILVHGAQLMTGCSRATGGSESHVVMTESAACLLHPFFAVLAI